MKAAVLVRPGVFDVREVPDPAPHRDSLVIKVHSVGICGSDLRVVKHGSRRVKVPAIIGHEVSGEVADVGSQVKRWKIRDYVAIGSSVPCGTCHSCRGGMEHLCNSDVMVGYQIPGGLAEYMAIPPAVLQRGSVVKFTAHTSFDEAAMAEPLACILHGFEEVRFVPGKSVVVLGAGPVGQMMAQTAKHLGASTVLLVGKSRWQLETARSSGIETMVNHSASQVLREAFKQMGGGYDIVMVACGDPRAQALAIYLAAKKGSVNFFGVAQLSGRGVEIQSNEIHYKELLVTGSHSATSRHHRRAVALLRSNDLRLQRLVSHTFSLDQIQEAFHTMEHAPRLKIIIRPNG